MLRTLPPFHADPFARNSLLRSFDELLRDPFLRPAPPAAAAAGPRVNGYRTDAAWHLVFELPGFKAEELEVRVEDGALVVQGRHTDAAPQGARLLRRERPAELRFSRRFDFGDEADLDKVGASLKDGVLTLTVPRRAPATRKIAIQVG